MQKKLISLLALLLAMAVGVPSAMAFSKDSLVLQKCTMCHGVENGRIARVQDIRTTPEEWRVIVNRMARLHGMDLKPGEMHTLLKELCATQSLSPDEAKEVAYLDLHNNPQTMEKPLPNDPKKLFVTCVRCHSAGKIHSYRMTASAWSKLRDFHLYMYPTVVYQMRDMRWIPEADSVLRQLAKSQPYGRDWKTPTASPAGSWVIVGHEPGKGDYLGHASIRKGEKGDYTVTGSLDFANGKQEGFHGRATLYGGYALRTHLDDDGFTVKGAYSFDRGTLHGERSFAAPNYQTAYSTWYRQSEKAKVLRVSPSFVLSGETTTLRLEGMNLPSVHASNLKINGGSVKVLSAKRLNRNLVEAQVVYLGNGLKHAKVSLQGLHAGSLVLAPQIDYIAVTPQTGRARLYGGKKFPAEGVQYEAIAYSNGADALNPADDVELGPVRATFHLSEDVTRPGDDDLRWLGKIEPDGTYLPVGTYEPIPARNYHAEGTGMVYVNADYQRDGHQYHAKAKLVVTDPDFIARIR